MTQPAWLREAEKHIGYKEGPNNDNRFGKALGLNHEPWCDLFVAWCCEHSGHPLPSMQPGMRTGAAAVAYSIAYAKKHGLWVPSWDAEPGFQICYGWDGPGSTPANMHTGFVVSAGRRGSTGHTVEGNRGDRVGRFTFTVGEDVVLGTIDLPRLLHGRPKVTVKTKPAATPEPQPRNPEHPSHTGPTKKQLKHRVSRLRAILAKIRAALGVKK